MRPQVSIRTRHRCRVKRRKSCKASIQRDVSIRTRHRCRVKRHQDLTTTPWRDVSIRTRHRCRVKPFTPTMRSRAPGFNPHPASLPGEAPPASFRWRAGCVVSIRTRHRCRVKRRTLCRSATPRKVSIRTRHRCRVKPRSLLSAGLDVGFNPHPASLPGEALQWRRLGGGASKFQSAPGIAAG